jgi:hypothetical protein
MNQSLRPKNSSLNETWQEIASLVDELWELARTSTLEGEFYSRLLAGAVRATVAEGAFAWRVEEKMVVLIHEVVPGSADDVPARRSLLKGQAWSLVQRLHSPSDALGNGAKPLISDTPPENDGSVPAAIVVVDQHPVAVLQLIPPPDGSPGLARGMQGMLEVLAQVAVDFHERRELGRLRLQSQNAQDLRHFMHDLLSDADWQRVVYLIVNEGRRLLACDRLSLLMSCGTKHQVLGISGVESIDPRSVAVLALERTAAALALSKVSQWFDRSDLSLVPGGVQRQFEGSTVKTIGWIPFTTAGTSDRQHALLVEVFDERTDGGGRDLLSHRAEEFSRWVAAPLAHADRLNRLPLVRIADRFRPSRWWHAWKGWSILLGSASVLAWVSLWPADFVIDARGEFQPVRRDQVFAPLDGNVVELPLHQAADGSSAMDGLPVRAGEMVARIENHDLEYELTTVLGDRATALRQLETVNVKLELSARGPKGTAPPIAEDLTAEKLALEIQLASLGRRAELLQQEQSRLRLCARCDGRVQSWDALGELLQRPVRQGERLMVIADVDGPWQAVLFVADRHIGYLWRATNETGQPLPVELIFKSDPENLHKGKVNQIAAATESHVEHGRSLRVTVTPDEPRWNNATPGTTVMARIHCGRRSIAYVWLYDFIELLRTRVLFWW